jgi:hypothetical protein
MYDDGTTDDRESDYDGLHALYNDDVDSSQMQKMMIEYMKDPKHLQM